MDGKLLTGWIPVAEKLPEPGMEVLAQWVKTIRQTNEVYTYMEVFGGDTVGRWCRDYV